MILVDTSVWVEHFRRTVPELVARLERNEVMIHPFIIGELACGNLVNRDETLELLSQLRPATVSEHDEVLGYISGRHLYGRGVGYVDVHLLSSASIDGALLWTGDKRLHSVAAELGLAVSRSALRQT